MQVNKGHEHAPDLQVSGHEQEAHTDNERRLLAQYAMSSILLEAANLNEAAYRILEAIGSTLDWELGAFWMVDHERSLLSCITTWHGTSLSGEGFEAASRQIQFEAGTGLPGRVWQNEQPIWVSDVHFDSNFPRIAAADCEGLHSAFAFPIRGRNSILGVIEFFSREERPPDEYLVRTVITIGNHIGQFIEKQRAEEVLQQAAQEERARAGQLETIIEAISDAVIVYDANGQLTQANAAFREMIGIDVYQDFITQSVDERFSHLDVRDEHGYPLPQEQWAVSRILQGEVLKGANTVDYTIHTLDGREIQVNAGGAPIRDANGTILGGVAIIRDVTERRRLERRTEESLSALLDMAQALIQTPDEVAENRETRVSNPETINAVAQRLAELICSVLGCKRAAITAVEPETGEHRSIAVVGLSPEQERRWRSRDSGYHLSEQFGSPEFLERLHAGEAVVFDMTQPPFRNQPNPFGVHTFLLVPMSVGSQQVGVLSLDYDRPDHIYTQEEIALAQAIGKLAGLVIERERLLSERAAAQANELALRETNRRMDEFLGMTSHELKTPLTSIKGNTQLALRQLRNAPKKEGESPLFTRIGEQLASIDDQARRLNRLVEDLLDVSRIQSGHLEVLLAPCDLTTIVSEAVKEQRQAWSKRTIILNLPGKQAPVVPVLADADRIRQVITNYLTNALKYSEADRPVEVTLSVAGRQTRVSVRDEGMGISPEKQAHIWDRFYRVHGVRGAPGTRELHAGLGLGLYISKSIIEQHHGRTGLQSTPGLGSTFWFALPLAHSL